MEVKIDDGLSNVEYHAERFHESATTIGDFLDDPEEYFAVRVARTRDRKPVGVAAMLGTAFHTFVLEPERFALDIAVGPKGKSHLTNDFKAFASGGLAGRSPLPEPELCKLEPMRDAVFANPAARELIEAEGVQEQTVFWTDPKTGVGLKCRFDKLIDRRDIVDFKTNDNPYPGNFVRDASERRYELQTALYMRGREIAYPRIGGARHKIIAVRNRWPFTAIVYEYDAVARDIGRQHLEAALQHIAELRSFNGEGQVWRSPMHGRVNRLSVPAWKINQDEWGA